jgi:hypothetical protein
VSGRSRRRASAGRVPVVPGRDVAGACGAGRAADDPGEPGSGHCAHHGWSRSCVGVCREGPGMTDRAVSGLRVVDPPFVASGPAGVAVRTRLRVTDTEADVLARVGVFLGGLAGRDLAQRCRDGLDHDTQKWADRKRSVTGQSSSRWAGAITKASHDQWARSRRAQAAHLASLDAGIAAIGHRLCLPVGQKGRRGAPGGYRSRQEWHAKSRRLANTRHHLDAAGLTEQRWRDRWQAARLFLSADAGPPRQRPARPVSAHPARHVRLPRRRVGRPGRRGPGRCLRHHPRPRPRPLAPHRGMAAPARA